MYRRKTPKGTLAISFGVGLIVASCCPESAVIFILAAIIIVLGLCCAVKC